MKLLKSIIISLFLIATLITNAQETDQLHIILVDSSWGKEIIKFPIDWAPKLTLEGFEELHFAPQWSNEEHEEFWSLVMAWKVKTISEIPLYELEFNLIHYFDGLMKPNHWANEFPIPLAEFSHPVTTTNGFRFAGKLTFFDGFHTGKIIKINFLGHLISCKQTKESVIVFKFSPKNYNEPIWDKLNKISVIKEICPN
ncbi:hypothetical protein [Psychroserpens mesophilus]|uniref:hypothetical protein n=1 Tax=Psychroserpens mesophilus TaxID=325473 RepID=UPI000590FD25|nr:hypothetical protein [Psychroserpens mesophilus]